MSRWGVSCLGGEYLFLVGSICSRWGISVLGGENLFLVGRICSRRGGSVLGGENLTIQFSSKTLMAPLI